jgi:hypothetical protein
MQNVGTTTTSNRLIKTTTEIVSVNMKQAVVWERNKVSAANMATYNTEGAEWCMIKGIDSVGAEGSFRVFKKSWDAAAKTGTESVNFNLAYDFTELERPRSFLILPTGTDHTQQLMAKLQAEIRAERKAEQELFMARVSGLAPVNHMQLTPAQQALAANVTAESAI